MLSKAVTNARTRHGYTTSGELASRCGVHRTTVSLAIRRGALRAKRVGNVHLIASKDAAAFISKYRLK